MTQTILGAGGAIGVELAKALPAFTSDTRFSAVGSSPKHRIVLSCGIVPMDKNSVSKIEVKAFVAQSGAHVETLGAEAIVIEPAQGAIAPFFQERPR